MISYLKGQAVRQPQGLIVICHGVGYGVQIPERVYEHVDSDGQIELFVHTHVREDALELFGFANKEEQSVFELLLDVSGVGPKTALQILNFSPSEIVTAVQQADIGFFSQVPRVGKKLAQKIIIELRSKLGSLKDLDLQPLSQQHQEVKEALLQLGFAERDIDKVLPQLDIENQTTAAAIKAALPQLTRT
ncbi:Holliday junction branch migration protein RuvA [Patescibacteria group bacterium]|nr:Holliday junction branch migration protein RuvA [Patescibacteria group bacterium]